MTRYHRSTLVAVLVILAGGCEVVEPDARPKLELEGESIAVAGEPVTVRTVASDDNGLTRLVVTWGDGAADTIPLSGASATQDVGHAFATLGTFMVEARVFDDGGQEAASALTVSVSPASIVIEPAVDTVNALGFTTTLTATAYDADGGKLAEFVPEWESLDPARATVGTAGVVTAVGPGKARIRVTSGGAAGEAEVLVRQVVASLVLTAPDTLGVRERVTLAVTAADSNDVPVPEPALAWASLAPATAEVDGSGALTGVGEGAASVVASAGTAADTATVEVALTLLVSVAAPDSAFDIYTMTRHGTARRNLTNYERLDHDAAWSPDRRRIAFWSLRTPGGVILLMDDDGSNVQELPTGLAAVADFDWSPDGTRIAFAGRPEGASNDDIYVIDLDGSNLTRLTTDTLFEEAPAWSPDGTSIAYVGEANVEMDIVVMNPDGSDPINLTGGVPGLDLAPAWSPDGAEIAFVSTRQDDGTISIHRMNADGTNIRQIGTHSSLDIAWSPDGAWFAFTSDDDGQRDIYLLPADGGEAIRVTSDTNTEEHLRWR